MNTLKQVIVAAMTLIAWLAINAGASAAACTVNGNAFPFSFPTITAALDSGASFISFDGTCSESPFIGRDNVTISGASPNTSVIVGEVSIVAATGVRLNKLAITPLPSNPGGNAVFIGNVAQAFINNCIIDAQEEGVFVARNSSARLLNNTINSSNTDLAVGAADDSTVFLFTGNTVTLDGNQPNAVATLFAARNSEVRLGGGNTILVSPPGLGTGTGTGTTVAASVFENSTLRQDNLGGFGGVVPPNNADTIQGDIKLFRHAVADIRNAQLSGNVTLNTQSILTLGDTSSGAGPVTIDGDITANSNSIIEFATTAPTVNGRITCLDTLSQLTSQGPLNVTIQPIGTGCIRGNQNSQ